MRNPITTCRHRSILHKRYEYKSTHMIIARNTETVIEAGLSGLNTRAGGLLTVNLNIIHQRQAVQLRLHALQI